MRYRSILVVVVLAALSSGVAGAAPPQLPPQAAEIARQAGQVPVPVAARPATPAEVRRAFAHPHPGQETEGTPPADTTRTFLRRATEAAVYCWFFEPSMTWEGWSPWWRKVTQHTYLCGQWAGAITARTTWTTADAALCSQDAYNYKVGGGIGYSWVYVESGGYFSCPTAIPWVTLHVRDWFRVYYITQGAAWILESGES